MFCAYCCQDSFRFYKPLHLTRFSGLRFISKSSNEGMCHEKCSHLAPIVNSLFMGDLLNCAFCSHEFVLTEERKGGCWSWKSHLCCLLTLCPSLLSFVAASWPKVTRKRKSLQSCYWGKSRQELKLKLEKQCLVARSPWTQGYLPRGGTGHHGLAPPTIIVHQENGHTDLLVGRSHGGHSSAEVPSCPAKLLGVGLTKFNRHTFHVWLYC